MKKIMKRVAAINDISSVGKCSLTVVIPILSSMEIEVCPIVTAVLSAHTGFEEPVIADLTDKLEETMIHIDRLNVEFDCIFSGYLGSNKQMDIVKEYMQKHKGKSLCLCDPVLGDGGVLYSTFDANSIEKMKELCLVSDVITPNYTEACFLSGVDYEKKTTKEIAIGIIRKLHKELKLEKIVITGIPFKDGSNNILIYDNGKIDLLCLDYVKGEYCGTGDAFSSVLCGNLLNEKTLCQASKKAHEFVKYAIDKTYKLGGTWEQGIVLEKFLNKL